MHNALLEKKTELENQWKARAAELAAEKSQLEKDPDYCRYQRAVEVSKELEKLKNRTGLAEADYRIAHGTLDAQIRAAADSQINEKIKWCAEERIRTSKELKTASSLEEKNFLGFSKGFLVTNELKIKARVEAIDVAIKLLEALKYVQQIQIAMKIEEILSRIPRSDFSEEKIEVTPGWAAMFRG